MNIKTLSKELIVEYRSVHKNFLLAHARKKMFNFVVQNANVYLSAGLGGFLLVHYSETWQRANLLFHYCKKGFN